MRYFEQMQDRITGFVTRHSSISEARFTQLMMRTGELVMDVGTVLDGPQAVGEGLIDELGSVPAAADHAAPSARPRNVMDDLLAPADSSVAPATQDELMSSLLGMSGKSDETAST